MSNEKQKDDKQPKPKQADGSDSTELDSENLDGVSGGLRPAIPDFGGTGLPGLEIDKCIA